MLTKRLFNQINLVKSSFSKSSLLRPFGFFDMSLKLRKPSNKQISFYNAAKAYFSADEETHSDFKPKSKVDITDENVMQQIDSWVKENDVLLFMKGVPQMPQCGFSNYVIQVLKFYNVKNFKAINILENNILRENVKKYSNWPTYPQLYVKGQLVGNKCY